MCVYPIDCIWRDANWECMAKDTAPRPCEDTKEKVKAAIEQYHEAMATIGNYCKMRRDCKDCLFAKECEDFYVYPHDACKN